MGARPGGGGPRPMVPPPTSATRGQATRAGRQRLGVDDGQLLHRPGQRDVEQPAAALRRRRRRSARRRRRRRTRGPWPRAGASSGDHAAQPAACARAEGDTRRRRGRRPPSSTRVAGAITPTEPQRRGQVGHHARHPVRQLAGRRGDDRGRRPRRAAPTAPAARQGRPPGAGGWRRRGSGGARGSRARAPRSTPVAGEPRWTTASSQLVWAPGAVAWARSPSTVIDRDGHRRATARSSIAERSWASSTTAWP